MSIKLVTFDLDDTLWDNGVVITQAEAKLWDYLNAEHPLITQRLDSKKLRQLVQSFNEEAVSETTTVQKAGQLKLDQAKSNRAKSNQAKSNQAQSNQAKTETDQIKLNKSLSQAREAFLKIPPHHLTAKRLATLQFAAQYVGYAAAEAQQVAQAALTVFLSARSQVTLFPGAIDLLNELADTYLLAALTNGNVALSATSLHPCFDFALNAEQVGAAKPAAEFFQKALALAKGLEVTMADVPAILFGVKFNLDTGIKNVTQGSAVKLLGPFNPIKDLDVSHCCHIGDSWQKDVLGAHAAGWHAIWYNPENVVQPAHTVSNTNARIISVTQLSDIPAVLKSLR